MGAGSKQSGRNEVESHCATWADSVREALAAVHHCRRSRLPLAPLAAGGSRSRRSPLAIAPGHSPSHLPLAAARGSGYSRPLAAAHCSPLLATARRRPSLATRGRSPTERPLAAAPARPSLATRGRSPTERRPPSRVPRLCLAGVVRAFQRCVLFSVGRLPFLCVLAVPCLGTDCVWQYLV